MTECPSRLTSSPHSWRLQELYMGPHTSEVRVLLRSRGWMSWIPLSSSSSTGGRKPFGLFMTGIMVPTSPFLRIKNASLWHHLSPINWFGSNSSLERFSKIFSFSRRAKIVIETVMGWMPPAYSGLPKTHLVGHPSVLAFFMLTENCRSRHGRGLRVNPGQPLHPHPQSMQAHYFLDHGPLASAGILE